QITKTVVTPKFSTFSNDASWVDYDHDGLLDLFVPSYGATSFLYRNIGNGTFATITNSAIVKEIVYGPTSSWADYDNDGFDDLLVAVYGLSPSVNLLYHNNGDGTFTKITSGRIVTDNGFVKVPSPLL